MTRLRLQIIEADLEKSHRRVAVWRAVVRAQGDNPDAVIQAVTSLDTPNQSVHYSDDGTYDEGGMTGVEPEGSSEA